MLNLFSQITCLAATSLCRMAIWMGLIGFVLAIGLAVRDGYIRLRRLHQIPCSRCAFFTGDYRLKCTVHPCTALSEDAIDCIDYEPLTKLQSNAAQCCNPLKPGFVSSVGCAHTTYTNSLNEHYTSPSYSLRHLPSDREVGRARRCGKAPAIDSGKDEEGDQAKVGVGNVSSMSFDRFTNSGMGTG